VVSPQLSSQSDSSSTPNIDVNNNIYIPCNQLLRLEDSYSDVRDEIDGIYLNLADGAISLNPRKSSGQFSIHRMWSR